MLNEEVWAKSRLLREVAKLRLPSRCLRYVTFRRSGRAPTLKRIEELAQRKHVSPYQLGMLHAGLGDFDRAFDYFEKAYEERSSLVLYLGVDPNTATMTDHPRAKALLEKLALSWGAAQTCRPKNQRRPANPVGIGGRRPPLRAGYPEPGD